ncbi:MAG: hypothetical protein V3G42_10800 [Oscillospiraceae bacterium]
MTESGNLIQAITDKQYLTVNSGYGAEIVKGLDLSGIPYFAKFDESVIYLTFSSANKDSVDEIIRKSDKFPDSDYLSLLPEIADILHCTVSELQSRPHEMLDILTKTYINYWHSDRQAIQNALERITDLNRETENELAETVLKPDIPEKSQQTAHISREMQKQFAEELHRNQAYEHEKQLERSVTDARERKQSDF